MLAYASLGLAALLMFWVFISPKQVLGQSKAGEKVTVAAANVSEQKPNATPQTPKQQAAASKARLSEAELERLREQIVQASKQNIAKNQNKSEKKQ